MVRYLHRRDTNYRRKPNAPSTLDDALETEYRELQELRERVRKAEAAKAKRLRQGGKRTSKGG